MLLACQLNPTCKGNSADDKSYKAAKITRVSCVLLWEAALREQRTTHVLDFAERTQSKHRSISQSLKMTDNTGEPPNYEFDLLDRRRSKFVLWIPGKYRDFQAPRLILGRYSDTGPRKLNVLNCQELEQSGEHPSLWELAPSKLKEPLTEGLTYHYWFEVQDTAPESYSTTLQLVTDPLAFALDYRICMNDDEKHRAPAAIFKYYQGNMVPCDIKGEALKRVATPVLASASTTSQWAENRQLVIYELPTTWVKGVLGSNHIEVDRGTFDDVRALLDKAAPGQNFAHLAVLASGNAILPELGVNAIELLPVADAKPIGEWGYATAHYFTPDADLGTASDLAFLSETMRKRGIRLFTDVVTAFGRDPYRFIDFETFHIRPQAEPANPDSRQSGNNGDKLREGWGGENFRYVKPLETYDPATGGKATLTPARSFHIAHLTRWMRDFGISGLRLDSVNNTGSWDFIREYRAAALALWRSVAPDPSQESRFLVVGEELSMPAGMLDGPEPCLDSLWNEPWQKRVRAVIVGEGAEGDNFEWTVRKMVDSRLDSARGFSTCTQAVNYITSHDVGGYRHERLCNYLRHSRVGDVARRAKLAHVCLLTSFGIPMILAGEEFCDEHDRPIENAKQVDPVNWARLDDPWRRGVFDYVKRLVSLRTKCPALGSDNASTFHVDLSRQGGVVAWKRGGNGTPPVVVVANFSDENTPGTEYYVPNWPDRSNTGWREVTEGRKVSSARVGREPLGRWEAKVYTYWPPPQDLLETGQPPDQGSG